MAITKWSIPVEAISASLGMSQAFATSSPPSRSAGALLHPAEDIGSALKGGVNVCQRQLVNEVFGPLVTKFVRNFGREDATPFSVDRMAAFSDASKLSNSSDIILRASSEPPTSIVGRLLRTRGSKV
jgi:hypothetical protein